MLKTPPTRTKQTVPEPIAFADGIDDDVVRELERVGVVKIEGLYDRGLIKKICDEAYRIYFHRDKQMAEGGIPDEVMTDNHRQRAIWLNHMQMEEGGVADLLANEFVARVAQRVLKVKPQNSPNSYVRCARPGNETLHLPFHQDSRILKAQLINLWVPLMACGTESPSLEVVASRVDQVYEAVPPAGTLYTNYGIQIDPDRVIANHGRRSLWHPEFEVGDALMFMGTTVHRTHLTEAMTRERLSIDLRLVGARMDI